MGKHRKLAGYVYVDGTAYGPNDDVPDSVAEQITNPKAWASESDVERDSSEQVKPGTSSGARLASYVNVDGTVYGPNDDVPDDVAAQISNPKAWEGGKLPSAAKGGVVRGPGSKDSDKEPSGGSSGDGHGDGAERPARIPAPPRAGAGSGKDAWAAFASTQDVAVEDGASRDDIIAACEKAGVVEAAK